MTESKWESGNGEKCVCGDKIIRPHTLERVLILNLELSMLTYVDSRVSEG